MRAFEDSQDVVLGWCQVLALHGCGQFRVQPRVRNDDVQHGFLGRRAEVFLLDTCSEGSQINSGVSLARILVTTSKVLA